MFRDLLSSTTLGGGYLIGEGDTLEISVWGEKDLTVSVKVRPDGKITMPAVGEVAVFRNYCSGSPEVALRKTEGLCQKSQCHGERAGDNEQQGLYHR